MRLARDDVASSKPQNQQSQSEICNTVTLCNTLQHSNLSLGSATIHRRPACRRHLGDPGPTVRPNISESSFQACRQPKIESK